MNVESRIRNEWERLLRGSLSVASLLGICISTLSAQGPSRYVPAAPTLIAGYGESVVHEGMPDGGMIDGVTGNCEVCRSRSIEGVDCIDQTCGPELRWQAHCPLPWQVLAQGEYIGPSRTAHVPQYRLRVDDVVVFIFRLTRESSGHPYELNIGDKIRVESLQDDNLDRELVIQPDGTITLRLLGQVPAAGITIHALRQNLEKLYTKYYKEPTITVTPVQVNTKLEDLRSTVDNRQGVGGQSGTDICFARRQRRNCRHSVRYPRKVCRSMN